jgi:starch-binding outer membrane protein, SusD/RagB family
MKNIIWIAFILFGLSSCKKWLDVNPVSQVPENELFNTAEGFEEALTGVYTSCTNLNLYGYQLSVGFPEVLAQNYSFADDRDLLRFNQTVLYNYKDQHFVARKDTAWTGLYHAIVNCNLILKHLETDKDVLTADRHALIKAEALALRGFLHFDLLRLFAPSFKNGPGAKAIPYVTDFSNKVTPMSTVTEVLTKIAADLEDAKQLIRPVDPILTAAYIPSYPDPKVEPGDTVKIPEEESSNTLFLQNRRHHLNYYAICGELARVYLYQEKNNEALTNAREVINSQKFPWTEKSFFIESDAKYKDRIMYKELLFGWYAPTARDTLAARFNKGVTGFVIEQNAANVLYEAGGAGGDDRRHKQWFLPANTGSTTLYYELQKYKRDFESNLHYLMLPAIRLSEMYYIAAECAYDTDPAGAVGYLNTVRQNRGYTTDLPASGKEALILELLKEARKEFYAEGQIFYMYKRLNRNIPTLIGGNIPASDKIFVMPLPDNEIEFGNRP